MDIAFVLHIVQYQFYTLLMSPATDSLAHSCPTLASIFKSVSATSLQKWALMAGWEATCHGMDNHNKTSVANF
jgi:hypothetical protein